MDGHGWHGCGWMWMEFEFLLSPFRQNTTMSWQVKSRPLSSEVTHHVSSWPAKTTHAFPRSSCKKSISPSKKSVIISILSEARLVLGCCGHICLVRYSSVSLYRICCKCSWHLEKEINRLILRPLSSYNTTQSDQPCQDFLIYQESSPDNTRFQIVPKRVLIVSEKLKWTNRQSTYIMIMTNLKTIIDFDVTSFLSILGKSYNSLRTHAVSKP